MFRKLINSGPSTFCVGRVIGRIGRGTEAQQFFSEVTMENAKGLQSQLSKSPWKTPTKAVVGSVPIVSRSSASSIRSSMAMILLPPGSRIAVGCDRRKKTKTGDGHSAQFELFCSL